MTAPVQSCSSGTANTGDYDFDNLTDLVARFSAALLEKLKAAEAKYGHNSGWMRDDWKATCQRHLNEHLAKGDPRDVAAYCAFLWHHGWPTVGPVTPREYELATGLRDVAQAPSGHVIKDISDDALFNIATEAWSTQTDHSWSSDGLEAAILAVRSAVERASPLSSTEGKSP